MLDFFKRTKCLYSHKRVGNKWQLKITPLRMTIANLHKNKIILANLHEIIVEISSKTWVGRVTGNKLNFVWPKLERCK